jgi:hypothetical protein
MFGREVVNVCIWCTAHVPDPTFTVARRWLCPLNVLAEPLMHPAFALHSP